NFNYYKNAKWFVLASLSFMVISLIVFASISVANKDIWAGLNRNIEFTGGINLNIATDRNTANTLSLAEANEIKKQKVESSQTFNIKNVNSIIDIQKANEQGTNYVINIRSQ
ncbi:protein translocase subunit SecDF, partial [Mycoplasmopsis synoviae]